MAVNLRGGRDKAHQATSTVFAGHAYRHIEQCGYMSDIGMRVDSLIGSQEGAIQQTSRNEKKARKKKSRFFLNNQMM